MIPTFAKKRKHVTKNNTFSIQIDKESCMFSENPCAEMQKMQKCFLLKPLCFKWKIVKQIDFA